jgi:hypothetical protein
LKDVEDLTKKPIRFSEKYDLDVYARVKIARSGMSEHIIFYKKDYNEIINHLIAHECGHILRTFSAPEDKRLVPISTQNTRANFIREIEGDIKKLSSIMPLQEVYKLADLWLNGLIRQLTNYPPDIMIEKWIYNNYPELRPFQLDSILRQRDLAVAVLSDDIKAITPTKIYKSSNIMNYAFFNLLGNHIGNNLIKPYDRTPYIKKGRKLVSLTENKYRDNYEGDIEMINQWADFLSISNWFDWTNFENVSPSYLYAE